VPRIVLAAPTGKAAARLSAAIARTCDEMQCNVGVRDAIPREASTLHRLLGIGRERHGASALRLRVDVVLVDEASMIDLALMARLVSALSPQARLILLGDSDQLASVEAGSVFADLCGPERTPGYAEGTAQRLRELTQGPVPAHSPDFSNFSDGSDLTAPVGDCVVVLRRSHRYREQSGIGALARAIRLGDPDAALSVLRDEAFPDVTRVEPTQERGLGPSLREQVLAGYGPCFGDEAPTDPVEQLRLLDRFRVLCAVREGPAGLRSMNPRIDAALVGKGLLTDPGRLRAVDGAQALAPSLSPAPGRPILVTRNAPHLGLFNGDVGLLDAAGARACFDRGGEAVSFGIARLPSHELVFAMTVHKSQGSEFDEVALVLPPEPLPLVTRELVYTAVTRARTRVVVYASENVIEAGILARISRASGLRDALWPPGAGSGTVSVE
jgi:exodeoxyribonuclease V alpha subunit